MKITILDGYSLNPGDLSWKPFEELGDLTVYDRTIPEDVLTRSKDSEILITNKTVIPGDVLMKLPGLKYIGVLATGYNVVDIATAKELGIIVTNIPAYSTMSVAQKVFALLLAATDKVENYSKEIKEGKWSRNPDFCYWNNTLTELSGKTFGIIGLGNIGMAVARIAIAFDMKVKAFTSKEIEELPDGVEKATLDEIFKTSDVISLHCPLTPSTRHIINKDSLSLMKPSAIIINTGRGDLIDEKAVADALKENKISAFCADVLSSEPPHPDNPLLHAPNVYITPHIAWATFEARKRLMDLAASNLRSYLEGKPINVVNYY